MKQILINLIQIYQKRVSPFLVKRGHRCLFTPSCSQYAFQCLNRYSLVKALLLIVKRLLSCNPINVHLKYNRKELIYGKGV